MSSRRCRPPLSTSIPVLDLSRFTQGGPRDRRSLVQELYQACHQIGFVYLQNSGVDAALMHQAFAASQALFELPLAVKQRVAWSYASSNRGYVGVEREGLNPTMPNDLKEAFNLGKERSPAELAAAPENPSVQANQWPQASPEIRATLVTTYDHLATVVDQVLRAFALALDLPESYLVDRHQSPWFTLRLLHYPAISGRVQPGQLRAGAHSDYGTVTLLIQDPTGGLEIQRTDGEWIPAPAIPDTVIVNTGDLMERWSNGVFRSTRHRVVVPTEAETQSDLYALAFFCEPDPAVEICCLPTCCCRDRPAQYPPITVQDYLMERLQATYGLD